MLHAGFYLLLAAITLIIGAGFRKAAQNAGYDNARTNKVMGRYILFSIGWIVYVSIMAGSGFLADFSLPPKMVVCVVLPALLLVAIFFSVKKSANVIAAFPIALTVYYQTFRIFVELLIWGLAKDRVGPDLVTFEGRNFDILAGLSAPIIGYLAYHKKVLSHKTVIAWNIVCLLLLANIVFIFISLIVNPVMWGYNDIPVSYDFTRVPYIYIAGMFMPTAVFMHVFSIRKSLQALKSKHC